jgi:hypothetical protein
MAVVAPGDGDKILPPLNHHLHLAIHYFFLSQSCVEATTEQAKCRKNEES